MTKMLMNSFMYVYQASNARVGVQASCTLDPEERGNYRLRRAGESGAF